MPPRKRTSSVLNGEGGDLPKEADRVTDPDDALAAAEVAEAEAAEAEAAAAAARARARAIRLRREAAVASKSAASKPAEVEPPVTEVDEPATEAAPEPPIEAAAESPTPTAPADAAPTDSDDSPAAEVVEAPEPAVAEQPVRSRRPLLVRVGRIAAVTVAILSALALLGLSGAMYQHHHNVEAQRQQSAEFAAAARQSVVTLMSLDFNKAKEDVQRIIDNTTGDFKKDFAGQAEDFVKVAQESKVVTEANVNAVAVQAMTKDTATVLVAVTTQVSNLASKQQQPRSWRLAVDVAREGDQIKLAKVEFVP